MPLVLEYIMIDVQDFHISDFIEIDCKCFMLSESPVNEKHSFQN